MAERKLSDSARVELTPVSFEPMNGEHIPIPFIRKLCEGNSEEELVTAENNFRRYLLVVKRICERREREEEERSNVSSDNI